MIRQHSKMKISKLSNILPSAAELIKNIKISITLSEWAAVVAIAFVCCAAVSIAAIEHSDE